jgi:Methyltransferase domain
MKLHLRNCLNALARLAPDSLSRLMLKAYGDQPLIALNAGYRVFPRVFYSPIVDPSEVNVDKLTARRQLPGIKFDMAAYAELISELSIFTGELEVFPRTTSGDCILWTDTYPSFDSSALYCMIRHLKPKRYIEVGCGFSSRISSEALRRNASEGSPCEVTYIEPYPGSRLDGFELYGQLLVQTIQDTPLSMFSSMGQGDILFIDTSHVIKCQNDVEYELLHILPSLNKGVYIHIHDISTPYDQRTDWIVGPGDTSGAANEQYALECLLSGGDSFKVVLPLHLLQKDARPTLERLYPGASDNAQAFWIEKM